MTEKREKKALGMFVLLMLFGAACIFGYIVVGHNWNYTATDLDVTFGDMDEYTVVLYEGTIEAPKEQERTLTDRIANKLNQWFNFDTETEASQEEVDAVGDNPVVSEDVEVTNTESATVSIDEVVSEYRKKGARVFVVKTDDPLYYEEGEVVARGDTRIGILGVHSLYSLATIQAKVDELLLKDIDRLVVITDDVSRVAGVRGVDMVIRASSEVPETLDYASQGRYITFAPATGHVAVTIMKGSIASTKIL